MSQLVILKTYYHKHDAQMAQGLLNERGIDSILQTDDCGGFRPHISLSMGNARLLVQKEDVEQAKETLKVLDTTIEADTFGDMEKHSDLINIESASNQTQGNLRLQPELLIPLIILVLFILWYLVRY